MQDLSRHYDGGIADSPIGLAAWLLDHNDADGQPAAAVASFLNRDGGGCGRPQALALFVKPEESDSSAGNAPANGR